MASTLGVMAASTGRSATALPARGSECHALGSLQGAGWAGLWGEVNEGLGCGRRRGQISKQCRGWPPFLFKQNPFHTRLRWEPRSLPGGE